MNPRVYPRQQWMHLADNKLYWVRTIHNQPQLHYAHMESVCGNKKLWMALTNPTNYPTHPDNWAFVAPCPVQVGQEWATYQGTLYRVERFTYIEDDKYAVDTKGTAFMRLDDENCPVSLGWRLQNWPALDNLICQSP